MLFREYPYYSSLLDNKIKMKIEFNYDSQYLYKYLYGHVNKISSKMEEEQKVYFTDCLFVLFDKYSNSKTKIGDIDVYCRDFLMNRLNSLKFIENEENINAGYVGETKGVLSDIHIFMNSKGVDKVSYINTALHELIHAMSADYYKDENDYFYITNGFKNNHIASKELVCVHLTDMLLKEYFNDEVQNYLRHSEINKCIVNLNDDKNSLNENKMIINNKGKDGYDAINPYSNIMFAIDGDEIQSSHFKVSKINNFDATEKYGSFEQKVDEENQEIFAKEVIFLSNKYKGLNDALYPLALIGEDISFTKDIYSNANREYLKLAKNYIDENNLDLNDYIRFTNSIKLNMNMRINGHDHFLDKDLMRSLDVYYIYNHIVKNPNYKNYIGKDVTSLSPKSDAVLKAYNPLVKNPELDNCLQYLINARNGIGCELKDFLNSIPIPRNENYPKLKKKDIENVQAYSSYLTFQGGLTKNEKEIANNFITNETKKIDINLIEEVRKQAKLYNYRNVPFVKFNKNLLMDNLRFSIDINDFKNLVDTLKRTNPKCLEYYITNNVNVDGKNINPIEYCIKNKKYEYLNVLTNQGIDFSKFPKIEVEDVQTLAYYSSFENTSYSQNPQTSWFNLVKLKSGFEHKLNNDRAIFDLIELADDADSFHRDLITFVNMYGNEISRVYDYNNNKTLGDAFEKLAEEGLLENNEFIRIKDSKSLSKIVVAEAISLKESHQDIKYGKQVLDDFLCVSMMDNPSNRNLERWRMLYASENLNVNYDAIISTSIINNNFRAVEILLNDRDAFNNLSFNEMASTIDFLIANRRDDIIYNTYNTLLSDIQNKSIVEVKKIEIFNEMISYFSQQYGNQQLTNTSFQTSSSLIKSFGYNGLDYNSILDNLVKTNNYDLMKDTLFMMSDNNIDVISVNAQSSYYMACSKLIARKDYDTIFELVNKTTDEVANSSLLKGYLFDACIMQKDYESAIMIANKLKLTTLETENNFIARLNHNQMNFEQFENEIRIIGRNENLYNANNNFYYRICFNDIKYNNGNFVQQLVDKYDEVTLFGRNKERGMIVLDNLINVAHSKQNPELIQTLNLVKENYQWKVDEIKRQERTRDIDLVTKDKAQDRYKDMTLDIDEFIR